MLDRVLKREPWHYHHDRERWEQRTYPCRRWFCFRRSPAWRSFERGGKSWCDRHVPADPPGTEPVGPQTLGYVGGHPLPLRVVIGKNGAYWRDFGDTWSMCPVSSDNDPVEPLVVYVLGGDQRAKEA